MRARWPSALIGSFLIAALAWPGGATAAQEVTVTASIGASVERFGSDSWLVKISFGAQCQGVGSGGASYQGNLFMVDVDTAEEIYLGGVSGPSGQVEQLIHSKDRWQSLSARLKISCFDNATLKGSEHIETAGGIVFIPPRLGGHGGGGGGGQGGGGGGGGGSSGDPSEPLGFGGCLLLLVGTGKADTLDGGGAGDVIFGLGKADRIRGRDGGDCLVGGTGGDRLLGEDGHDRLTGGKGSDRLVGGAGVNAYDAGPGRDFVDAANGRPELVRCGPGRDRAKADPGDDLRSCELS